GAQRARRVRDTRVGQKESRSTSAPRGPLAAPRKSLPSGAPPRTDGRGGGGRGAPPYGEPPAVDEALNVPAITHHMLILFARPPEELELRYEGVKRHVPPPAGSVSLLPAGSPARVRSGGHKDELHVFLEPGLVGRVAAEAFGL